MTEELHNRETIHAGGLTFVRRAGFPFLWDAGDFSLTYTPPTVYRDTPVWTAVAIKHYKDDVYDVYPPCSLSPEGAVATLRDSLEEDALDVTREIDGLRAKGEAISGLLKALEVSSDGKPAHAAIGGSCGKVPARRL